MKNAAEARMPAQPRGRDAAEHFARPGSNVYGRHAIGPCWGQALVFAGYGHDALENARAHFGLATPLRYYGFQW